MKVVLEKNIENPLSSITTLDLRDPYFDPNWHFHPHYQLFTVLEGTGTRLIGDSISHFEPGDTVFLGPDLPHLWRCDKSYFDPNSQLVTHGIVLYFTEGSFGEGLLQKPESIQILHLLEKSKRGLHFKANAQKVVISTLKNIKKLKGFDVMIELLSLLNYLSKNDDYEFITNIGYLNTHKVSETERMQKVYEYVMKNYKETIKLSDVASLAAMSESAFCRYFKKRANKTFSDFVAEIRIGQACKLISSEKYNIQQVCFESGFNTLSNFNKKFKEIVGNTPSNYLKEIRG
jgi:AraC-like DNA-binding protein